MTILVLLIALYVGRAVSAETNTTQIIDVKRFCEDICSNPKWEFSVQEKAAICLCWVDASVDDIDADAMQKQATAQGFTLWVIRSGQHRITRDVDDTSSIEVIRTIEADVPQPLSDPLSYTVKDETQDLKTKQEEMAEETKISKPLVPKKCLPKTDPIVGDSPKAIIDRLKPASRPRQTLPQRSCSPESIKFSLQNVKSHVNRLLERADHANLNCALLIPELEAVKNILTQLITKAGDRTEQGRSRLIDQIRERENGRKAKFQSRLGQFELPKKPARLNLLGSVHNVDIQADRNEQGGKPSIIIQPKELIDNKK